MPNINITVREKIAHTISDTCIVCGNSDYVAVFDFDAEWDAYETKTARFIWGGMFTDAPFTGNECPVPVIPDAVSVLVGVYAGELRTTTAAAVGVRRSILGGSETEAEVSHEIKDTFGKMLAGKIDAPQVAQVGEVLTVEEVDAEGKPKKWKTQAVQTEPPDWNENDPTKPGYVKNRTHHKTSEKLIDSIEFIATSETDLLLKDQSGNADDVYDGIAEAALSESNVIKVIVDGKSYTANAYYSRYVAELANGEVSWAVGGPAGYSRSLSITNGNASLITNQTYEVKFYRVGEFYKPLDEKYFPDTIFTQNNAPVRFGKSWNSKNFPSAVQGYNTEATGESSHAEGKNTNANTADLNVSGRYNLTENTYIIETQEGTDYYYNNTEVYYSNEFTFDADTGKFSLVDPQEDVASAISMIGKYCMTNGSTASFVTYIKSLKTSYSNRKIYNITKYTSFNRGESGGTYALIVGNGNSDDKRSNAHTLDWEGNAWFAGNVYVGSTSGTNKDEGSVKLATEDQLTFCARVLIGPTKNDDGTITYSASFPALFVYGEIFEERPVAPGNSVECCLMPNEDDGPLTVLNYTGMSIDQNSDGNTILAVRFSSYVSGKHISVEIQDTISGFRTDDKEILNTVVTVTESASLPSPTTAQVGQIVKVKAVDADGKITETEAVDMPSVDYIIQSSTTGSTKKFRITVDDFGTLTATELV